MPGQHPRFIHLRTHTEHSLLEGAVPVKKLVDLCVKAAMPAVAVTDTNNMFAALEFSVTAMGAGVQPITGCQISIAHDPAQTGEKPRLPAPIVLLAQTEQGYMNLMRLNTRLYIDGAMTGSANLPQVTLDELARNAEGLICLTGGPEGPLGRFHATGQQAKARAILERLATIYPNRLYVELQRHPGPGGALSETESLAERGAIDLAYDLGLPIVATNDVYFMKTEMYEAHDALICIAEGAYVDQQQPRRRLTPQHYFKSEAEMCALFADLPEALENTVEIAKRCAYAAAKRKPILPKFADDEVQELRRQANEGLQARLKVIPHSATPQEYQDRLDFELSIIEKMGFPGYFLIVADFIKWAKDHHIPVGPGRGSGAGSLVAYALTITDLDPLRYALLFERFLNPERVSMPDFDIDFCMDRREEVITYVQGKYGSDKVAQIITFGALLSKAAVRDVGRVLQLSYGHVDKLSKMIPVEGVKPVSITKALADEPRLREAAKEEVVGRLLDYAAKLEGLYRNASTHAAGVVIGDRPLDQLVPLYRDPRSTMPATQFNMKWVEAAGLVKFDFLGLKTLTVIQNAMDLLALRGISFDINLIPLDDKPAYDLYASAKTVAVFQVESSGMMDALRRMKPTCIEDIVALVALYRPGPMENIPTYCEVKNGLRDLESIHPTIDHILAETQGIIVYQEQVMQIAQVMAGYSLGGADLLRRAMGKKNPEEMARERPKFIEGAKATHNIPASKAGEVFDLLEKFANYGFNKSHAAAYAVVSYQTAYLKANYPAEFMAAVMNCDIHLTDKLAVYKREVDKLGIATVAPSVNDSLATFTVRDGAIVYGLGALKNVGVDAMQLIVQARRAASSLLPHGTGGTPDIAPRPPSPSWGGDGGGGHPASQTDRPFATLFDFARRVDLKRIGKRPLEMLARAGAFDQLDPNRARVFEALDSLGAYSAAIHEAAASAQNSLFGSAGADIPEPRLPFRDDWLPVERLSQEHQAIGFYLSGHPLDDYMSALRRKDVKTLTEVTALAERGPLIAKLAGSVSSRQERKSARGNRFAFVQLSDPTGLYEVTCFSEVLEASRDHLDAGSNVVLTVKAELEGETLKLLAQAITPIDAATAAAGAQDLRIHLAKPEAAISLASLLAKVEGRTRAAITLCVTDPQGREIDIDLPGQYPVTPQIKGAIKAMHGVLAVEEI